MPLSQVLKFASSAEVAAGTERRKPIAPDALASGYAPIKSSAVVSASGVAVDFLGLPAGLKRVTINFLELSSNGSADWLVRIGDSSGFAVSGYQGESHYWSSGIGYVNNTTGFPMLQSQPGQVQFGSVILSHVGGNKWVASGLIGGSGAYCFTCTGIKALSGVLDRIRIMTANGSDVFDAGSIQLNFE